VYPTLVLALVQGVLYALFAVGLVLVYRASRVINFAHGGFFALAYVLFYGVGISLNVSYWVALPGVVGYVAPGWFAALIRPGYSYFGRRGRARGDSDAG